jgi:hypothetical protein
MRITMNMAFNPSSFSMARVASSPQCYAPLSGPAARKSRPFCVACCARSAPIGPGPQFWCAATATIALPRFSTSVEPTGSTISSASRRPRRFVDIQHDPLGDLGIGLAIEVDHGAPHPQQRAGVRHLTALWGFPCCVRFPCVRAAATTPVPRLGVVFARLTQPYQPSPKGLSGRPAHRPFRGLLGVHSRCGPHTRAVTYRDPLHRRLQPFRYLHDCSGCFRLERSGRVGLAPTGKAPPCHGAHPLRTFRPSVVADTERCRNHADRAKTRGVNKTSSFCRLYRGFSALRGGIRSFVSSGVGNGASLRTKSRTRV